MNSLESRIARIEAMLPIAFEHTIVYMVKEIDSEPERKTIREKSIAEYEQRQNVKVDPKKIEFVEICIVTERKD